MTIKLLPADTRGTSDLDWLQSNFSFSFANYYNPDRMGFGALRVINDDIVAPGKGFGMHPHDNMEIITLVLNGDLSHKDSMGNETVVKSGDMQVMSAGSGLMHSEMNASETEPVSLFQMWIYPKEQNINPRHDEKTISYGNNYFNTVVSGDKDADTLYIHQDAKIKLADFSEDTDISLDIDSGNGIHLIVIEGEIDVEGTALGKRDAIEITEMNTIGILGKMGAKVMVIEVPVN